MENIDLEKIKIESTRNGKYFNILHDGNPLVFDTELLPVPFGLEESYNNLFVKVALKNIEQNKDSEELCRFITGLEEKLVNLTPGCDFLQSQIRFHERYDPILTIKVPTGKNTINIDVEDKNGNPFNLYSLCKNDYIKCTLLIDTVWYFKGKFSYKIKAKKIVVDKE